MMRRTRIATVALVYGKELRETLRDRRTLLVMVLFPLVVYPLMSLVLAQVMASKATKNAAHASRVVVSGAPAEAAALRKRDRERPRQLRAAAERRRRPTSSSAAWTR